MTFTTDVGKYVRMSPSQRVTLGAELPSPAMRGASGSGAPGTQVAVGASGLDLDAGAAVLARVRDVLGYP